MKILIGDRHDLIFGLNEQPVKDKLFVIELKSENVMGKITQDYRRFHFFE